ncbi:MAG: hypothetical protein ACYTF1_19770 [Planctomycetota bacterium]
MSNRKIRWCIVAVTTMTLAAASLALVSKDSVGTWPKTWPKELEPYRERATTVHDYTPGGHEDVYTIPFTNRDNFEKIWPTVLKLKDKGAPLRLRNGQAPSVRIYGPQRPGRLKIAGQEVKIGRTWPPESVRNPDGLLPEYIVFSKESWAWIPWSMGLGGYRTRARTDIELIVDGEVVDLNRIRLPAETPIIDWRILESEQKPPTTRPTGC